MAAFRAQLLANADVDLPGAAGLLAERCCVILLEEGF